MKIVPSFATATVLGLQDLRRQGRSVVHDLQPTGYEAAVPGDRPDHASRVDGTDSTIVVIGDVERPIRAEGDSLRSIEMCARRRASIAVESARRGAVDPGDRNDRTVDAILPHDVTSLIREIHRSVRPYRNAGG